MRAPLSTLAHHRVAPETQAATAFSSLLCSSWPGSSTVGKGTVNESTPGRNRTEAHFARFEGLAQEDSLRVDRPVGVPGPLTRPGTPRLPEERMDKSCLKGPAVYGLQ